MALGGDFLCVTTDLWCKMFPWRFVFPEGNLDAKCLESSEAVSRFYSGWTVLGPGWPVPFGGNLVPVVTHFPPSLSTEQGQHSLRLGRRLTDARGGSEEDLAPQPIRP